MGTLGCLSQVRKYLVSNSCIVRIFLADKSVRVVDDDDAH